MKSKRAEKGQISLEFLAGISFLLLVFILFTLLAYQKSSQANEFKSYLSAKTICQEFVENVNTIAEQGSSYYKYFTLPEKILGNYDYNLSTYGNRLQISWNSASSPYSLPIETRNLTIYCLDKGGGKKNKIINDHGKIIVTCYRPDLKPLAESFKPQEVAAGAIINLSIKIKNLGVLASGEFTTLFNSQNITLDLEPEERKEIKVEYSAPVIAGNYTILVVVDSKNEIKESIESDNSVNVTLEVK